MKKQEEHKMVSDLSRIYQSLVKQIGLRTRYTDFANQQIRRYGLKMGKDIFSFRNQNNRKKVYYIDKVAYNLVRTAYQNQYGIDLPSFVADFHLTRTEDKVTEDKKQTKTKEVEERIAMNPISFICEIAHLDQDLMVDSFGRVWGDLMADPIDADEIDGLCGVAVFDNRTQNFQLESLLETDTEDYSDDELAFRVCISKEMLLMMLYYYDKQDELTPYDVSTILDAWNSTLD